MNAYFSGNKHRLVDIFIKAKSSLDFLGMGVSLHFLSSYEWHIKFLFLTLVETLVEQSPHMLAECLWLCNCYEEMGGTLLISTMGTSLLNHKEPALTEKKNIVSILKSM